MNAETIREVVVPAMTVARFHGYGQSPEDIAFEKMKEWMQGAGISPDSVRIFGFNNPNPEPGSESYGYDFWVELPEGSPPRAAAASVETKQFDGGRYAALHHDGPPDGISATWKRLVAEVAKSIYEHAHHQWLEEHYIDFAREGEVLSLDCLAPIR